MAFSASLRSNSWPDLDETTGSSGMCPETARGLECQPMVYVPTVEGQAKTKTGGSLEQNMLQEPKNPVKPVAVV